MTYTWTDSGQVTLLSIWMRGKEYRAEARLDRAGTWEWTASCDFHEAACGTAANLDVAKEESTRALVALMGDKA